MDFLAKDGNGCPFLILAPMEGVGDRCFRKAIASIGGFDEAVRDFIRVPANGHIKSLIYQYERDEIAPIPLAPQLMGSNPDLMAEMTFEMELRGAHRVDLNCGCPSNTVTGRGAGSSLLKDPDYLYRIASSMVNAVSIPVTAKLRSGFEDTSLFKENLLAAQESGIKFLTLHPRTKVEAYGPPARWELIAEAKALLKIPVVGNGDILNAEHALNMLKMTKCDGLMIGRGSVINPFIFHEIKACFAGRDCEYHWSDLESYLATYMSEIPQNSPERVKISKMKQLLGFLFKSNPYLLSKREEMLRFTELNLEAFFELAKMHLKAAFNE